jgi:hypothetical protein
MSALDDLKREVPASPARRERVDRLKLELRRELALEEPRKDRGVSQAYLAEALGGELELTAVFGDERVPLRIE